MLDAIFPAICMAQGGAITDPHTGAKYQLTRTLYPFLESPKTLYLHTITGGQDLEQGLQTMCFRTFDGSYWMSAGRSEGKPNTDYWDTYLWVKQGDMWVSYATSTNEKELKKFKSRYS